MEKYRLLPFGTTVSTVLEQHEHPDLRLVGPRKCVDNVYQAIAPLLLLLGQSKVLRALEQCQRSAFLRVGS